MKHNKAASEKTVNPFVNERAETKAALDRNIEKRVTFNPFDQILKMTPSTNVVQKKITGKCRQNCNPFNFVKHME